MKPTEIVAASIALVVVGLSSSVSAFDSGSTATDDFSPAVSMTVQLPENGVLRYRNIAIPSGVTITFGKNTSNTPVILLASGDVTIAGKVDVSGGFPTRVGPLGDGNLFDDGQPGKGGPGGYDGGAGGRPSTTLAERVGGAGLGPGASGPIAPQYFQNYGGGFLGVGGAGFASTGDPSHSRTVGSVYGTPELLPLIGGSGGGGGHSNGVYSGGGGGGGGGALLIAASGALTLAPGAVITANGGGSWYTSGTGSPNTGNGGCGSGGAVRLVASRLIASGARIEAYGGLIDNYQTGGGGRVRIEADQIGSLPTVDVGGPLAYFHGASVTGTFTTGPAGPLFLPNAPSLQFMTIGGVPVPAIPTGTSDVTLPATTIDPVGITLRTTGIPSGSVIKVVVAPANGLPTTTNTLPTVGSVSSADANASVAIPVGHSTLQASVTFTLTLAQAEPLSRFAEGERVERVTLSSTLGKGNRATLHTATGREFPIEPSLLALAALPH